MVKHQRFALVGLFSLGLLMLLSFSSATSIIPQGSVQEVAAQGPTPTPNDPIWLAFSAARAALEDKLERNIQYVQKYEWFEAEFTGGISDCRALEEDEQPEFLFFGWRFLITTLEGNTYEIRTSFNYEIVVVCDDVTVGAPAAVVVDPAAVGLPSPVTGPVGPGGLEVGGQVTGLFPATQTALSQAGMRWIKFQATNAVAYPQVVARINEAHAAGYKILISALGDIPSVMDPQRQDDFASYVGSLAAAGADAIEVWNEPNIEREWPAGQISGANYTQLLAKAFNAIKSNNANTLVISGAPAPTGFFGAAGCNAGGCNDDVFYQQMAAAGAGQFMDCVGVHYNEGIVSPTQNSGDPRDNYPTRYYSSNLARALSPFPGKQACFTEIGYLTPEGYGGLPGNFAWAGNSTIANQAQWLGEAVAIAKASANVRLMIVFNVDFTTYTDDPQAGYAIIRADGTCPACANIAAALAG